MKNLTAVQVTSQVVIIAMYLTIVLFEEGSFVKTVECWMIGL